VNWRQALPSARGIDRGPGDAGIIDGWLERGDEDAFASVVSRVSASSTTQVDLLDAALLAQAATSLNPDIRLRLIKFYAIFKIAETRRYREFRGFPQ
jgi:hypothetical protein